MTVDLEAIARRGGCEVASLRNALPLLQQGYSPPFLARYRRDELGGVDEASLWALSEAVGAEQAIVDERDRLLALWEATPLADPAIGYAIRKANSKRMLERLARRLKTETAEHATPSAHLAVRLLNPRKGDGFDLAEIVTKVDAINEGDRIAAIEGVDVAIAERLAGDPRAINAAVKWLSKHAKINIASISDPHTPGRRESAKPAAESATSAAADSTPATSGDNAATDQPVVTESSQANAQQETAQQEATQPEATQSETPGETAEPVAVEQPADPAASETAAEVSQEHADTAPESAAAAPETSDSRTAEQATTEQATTEQATTEQAAAEGSAKTVGPTNSESKPKPKDDKKGKKAKKMSPRQRRRRWLVSVLQPLAGKRFAASKLSSFQVVMLGRALRSQVAQCSFEYDAAKLVAEIQRAVTGINRQLESKLKEVVLEHEANIREAAEAAWWDELHERASSRLVGVVGEHLRTHINRGCVDAKVVMSIDAVGPRTAAVSIVSADGRVLHCEDLPCQLSSVLRSQAVAKMGELIHHYHVDLIVISNGPARRGCMIALGDLIGQSPEKSVRWTLADRTGADVYAGSDVANQEMRTTPRRFRAAAWLAFSVLQPAQAFAKVDPVKLRLASFQRELSDDSVAKSLESIVVSGASRGGVDVNSASTEWLARLPGMTGELARAIDGQRRESLLTSRGELLELDAWQSVVESRQALPFLRVFGSEEALDGTLIHPDDYPLAKKLAKSLEIELPPAMPPGYKPPTFEAETPPAAEPSLSETPTGEDKPEVEDVSAAAEQKVDASFAENVDVPSDVAGGGEDSPQSEPAEAAAQDAPPASEPTEEQAEAEPATEDASTAPDETAEASADSATAETEQAADSPSSEEEASDSAAETPEPAPEPVRRTRPDQARIDKCIKEWQIGGRRANQLVSWLCDPFGDSDLSGRPPAVLTSMPSQKSLSQGDEVIGVVVGVMPFGVFVELAPDCSGLVHISKISDRYVEDLHEAIQVGDVITAWVTGIDEKKRRVALSAISPEREAQLQQQKRPPARGRGGRPQRGGGGERGAREGGGKPRGDARSRGGGGDRSKGRSERRDRSRRGGDRNRGDRRSKKPESYRVVGKAEAAPISDAMKTGDEPMRSFGDLMQFYGNDGEAPAKDVQQSSAQPAEQTAATAPSESAPPELSDSRSKAEDFSTPESASADAASQSTEPSAASQPTEPSAASQPTEPSAASQPTELSAPPQQANSSATPSNEDGPKSEDAVDKQAVDLPTSTDTSAS